MQAKSLLLCGALLPLAVAAAPAAPRAVSPRTASPAQLPAASPITGVVLDEKSQPLPGVTVLLKGTTTGATTDANGRFTLGLPSGPPTASTILVISFVGYEKQEVTVTDGQGNINIKLVPSAQALDEAVVIGYGTQEKRNLTNAVTTVQGAELAKLTVSDVGSALQGKASGVSVVSAGSEPGSQPQILIRGISTINGNSPLFVVDGLPVNDINYLNPKDIANLTVLKDAASAAIYGSRAANGVILITTKAGAAGVPVITVDATTGVSNPTRVPNMASASEYARIMNLAATNSGNPVVYPNPDQYTQTTDWWKTIAQRGITQNYAIAGDQREFGDFARFFWLPNNEWFDNRYTFLYQAIGNCNAALVGIDKAPIDNALKQQLLGEVKFIRAYNYFELVKGYGGVPLVTAPVAPSEAVSIPRASAADCYAQIIKDFKDAAAVLPEKSAQPGGDLGRATKGAATGYLAKAYLFTEQWTLAQQMAETVMNSNQYSLGDFDKVWSVSNPNGVESLFEINYNANQTFNLGTYLTVVMRSRADGGWGFNTPSSNLENAFKAENDPRLQWTILKQGDNVGPKTAAFDYSSYDTKLSENESGRISRKMFLPLADRPANEGNHSPLNRIELRYADLLLMHAEASYRLGQEAKALTSLNLVRARANRLSPGAVPPRTSSGTALLNHIWLERRLELAMEGHRYYDLVRQKRLVAVMQAFNAAQLTSTDLYDKGKVKDQISDKNNFFPIPTTQLQLSSGAIAQNPGY